jgi:hypothetical protein
MREWIFNARAALGWKGSGTPSELAPAPQVSGLGLGPSGLRALVLRVLRVNVRKHPVTRSTTEGERATFKQLFLNTSDVGHPRDPGRVEA